MLRPQDTATRERKTLDGLWRFAFDAERRGSGRRVVDGPAADAREVAVPASYNDLFADAGGPRPRRRRLVPDARAGAPRAGPGERIVAALRRRHPPSRRVGRRHAGRRARGWLHAVRGRRHRARRRRRARCASPSVVNNELTWQSIPPGYRRGDRRTAAGSSYFHDFFNYAGLHRSVWLYSTPRRARRRRHRRHRAGRLDRASSTTDVETDGADGRDVRVVLRDADGAEVARADGAERRR